MVSSADFDDNVGTHRREENLRCMPKPPLGLSKFSIIDPLRFVEIRFNQKSERKI